MKHFFLLLAFLLPSTAFGAFNVIQASSTHALGFDIEDVDLSSTASEIRVFLNSTSVYSRANACAIFVAPFALPNQDIDDNYVYIRPVIGTVNNFMNQNFAAGVVAFYNCRLKGLHYVALFSSAGDVSPDASDTIYLEQEALDHRSVFVIIFLIGALLAVLRPVISKLTLR